MSVARVASIIEVLGLGLVLRLRWGPHDLPADRGVLVFWMGGSLLSRVLVTAPVRRGAG